MKSDQKRKLWLNYILLLLWALAGLFIAITLFSETCFTVKAFEFTAALTPSLRGETVIAFPPLGKLRAATHRAPFQLEITLKNVDLDLLSTSIQELSASPDISFLQRTLQKKLSCFCLHQGIIVFWCSALLLLLVSGQNRRQAFRKAFTCGILAVLLLALLLGVTVIYPYESSAFSNPRFEGALAAAPWIVNLAGEALDTVNVLSEQLAVMAVNLKELSSRLDQLQPTSKTGEIRVLHVSDIHNNPAAFDLIEKVAASFQIDLIIDTGDLTDCGSNLEAELAARVARLPVPYLFVPGNHDSPQIIEQLRLAGAIIIGPEPVEISGLRIAGLADPAAASQSAEVAAESAMLEKSLRLKRQLQEDKASLDIFAVHNPLMGEPFRGELPLILSGHTHRAKVSFEEEGGSILINAGTTGAAGVRGLLAPQDNPYSAVVLYFNVDLEPGGKLTGVDLISIEQLQDSFTLQRFYNRSDATI